MPECNPTPIDERQARGLVIADRFRIKRDGDEWIVPSESSSSVITGVKTNIVASVEATATESADAPQLPSLVNTTAKTFAVGEVSGDKAYSSRRNLRAVEAVGAMGYIPFKERTNGVGNTYDGLWSRMWHYYQFNRDAFLEHYHKRSNVETTMSMIKAKFGAGVRSKTPDAQVNEVLLKVLCHNIVVLVQSIYELGLEPVFWTFEAERAAAPKWARFRCFEAKPIAMGEVGRGRASTADG